MPEAVPIDRRPLYVAAVFLGGLCGTGARIAAGHVIHPGAWPWATLAVNLVGAFALGLLTESTLRRDRTWGGIARALLGTGFCGGLTTYSTLALDAVRLGEHSPGGAVGYVATSLLLGVVAAGAGLLLGRWWAR